MHVFSKSRKHFASISDNGVLKVWDTETQELKCDYIPNLQTSAPCTSLIWVHVQTKRTAVGQDCLVLGTQRGGVAIFSLATGKLEATLKGAGHSGAVTGMCYDDEHTVYTTGEDGKVIVWSLQTCSQTRSWDLGNERPTAVTLSLDKKQLIIAARQIKLWTIKTNECKQTYTGHASSVHFLKVIAFEDAEYLISGTKQNRVLSLWNLRATSKKRDSLATFSLEDVPLFVDALCDNGTLSLIAVCRNNIVYHTAEAMDVIIGSTKPIKMSANVSVVDEKKTTTTTTTKQVNTIPTVAASAEDLSHILLAYGSSMALRFERVRLQRGKKSEVLIRKDPRKVYGKPEKNGDHHRGTVDPIEEAGQVEYAMVQAGRKSLRPNDIQIGKRLENLSLSKGDAFDHTAPAANKTQLLIQGLHSNDKTILAEIFSTNDNHSVRSTLQKLPPQYIGSLVNELTALMQQKIDKIELGVSWMKVLLQTHTSQLMALGADELMNRFGPCMGIIEHRINNLKNLNRIKGRLDLLLNQMEDQQPNVDIIETVNEQMLVYQDESEESDGGIDDDEDEEDNEEDGAGERMNGVEEDSEEDENMVTDDESRQTDEEDEDGEEEEEEDSD